MQRQTFLCHLVSGRENQLLTNMWLADGYHSAKKMVPITPCSVPQVMIAGVSMIMVEKFKGLEEEVGQTVINLKRDNLNVDDTSKQLYSASSREDLSLVAKQMAAMIPLSAQALYAFVWIAVV